MTSVRHSYIWKITIGENNAAAAYFIPIMQPLGYIFFFQPYGLCFIFPGEGWGTVVMNLVLDNKACTQ